MLIDDYEIEFPEINDEAEARRAIEDGELKKYLDRFSDGILYAPLDEIFLAYKRLTPILRARVLERVQTFFDPALPMDLAIALMNRTTSLFARLMIEGDEETEAVVEFMVRFGHLVPEDSKGGSKW